MIMQYFVTKWVEVISNVLLEGDYGQLNHGTASRFRFNPVEMPKINVWIGVWPKSLQSNKCKNDTVLSNYSISFKINNFENPQVLKGPWVKSHKLIIQKIKGFVAKKSRNLGKSRSQNLSEKHFNIKTCNTSDSNTFLSFKSTSSHHWPLEGAPLEIQLCLDFWHSEVNFGSTVGY